MNPVDLAVFRLLTAPANLSPGFDAAVEALSRFDLAKGAVSLAIFWGVWFGFAGQQPERRQVLLAGLLGTCLALFVAAGLAVSLPFRLRPLLAHPTEGMTVDPDWYRWSSFPSDHATLFFALAVTIWRAHPQAGRWALLHAAAVVAFPRMYIGLHYPTDILAGGLVGGGIAWLATHASLRKTLADPFLRLAERYPGPFHAILFVVSWLVSTLFRDLRALAKLLVA